MGMIKTGRFTFTKANDMESTRIDSVLMEDDPVEGPSTSRTPNVPKLLQKRIVWRDFPEAEAFIAMKQETFDWAKSKSVKEAIFEIGIAAGLWENVEAWRSRVSYKKEDNYKAHVCLSDSRSTP